MHKSLHFGPRLGCVSAVQFIHFLEQAWDHYICVYER